MERSSLLEKKNIKNISEYIEMNDNEKKIKQDHLWSKERVPKDLHALIDESVKETTWRENQEFKIYFGNVASCWGIYLCLVCCREIYDRHSDEEVLFVWKRTSVTSQAKYCSLRGSVMNRDLVSLLFLLMDKDVNGTKVTRTRISQWLKGNVSGRDLIDLRRKFVLMNYNLDTFFA